MSDIVFGAKTAFRNWTLVLPGVVLGVIVGGAAVNALGLDLRGLITGTRSTMFPFSSPPNLQNISLFFLIVLIGLLLTIIVNAGVYLGAGDAVRGRPVRLSTVAFGGVTFFGTFLLFYLLVGAIALVPEIVVAVLMAFSGGALAVVVVPFWCCLVAIASYGLLFVPALIVFRGASASSALIDSWDLAFGNVGRVLPVVLSLVAVYGVMWLIDWALRTIPVVEGPVSLVLELMFYVLQVVMITKLFFDLKGSGVDAELA
ncbi:MAG TPA: hypothetical protein VID24_08715 [Candidatus Eremiobacteraceae bacterium]|jgi:hypothetical protein